MSKIRYNVCNYSTKVYVEEKQLKSLVLDSGLASGADLSAAEREAREKGIGIGRALVNLGKISEDDLRRLHAYVLGMPFIDLKAHKAPFDVLSLIPEPIARNHNVIAFRKSDDTLEIALLDVEDLVAVDFLKKKAGLKLAPRLTDAESMKTSLLRYQKALKTEFGDIIGREALAIKTQVGADSKSLADGVSVVRIVDTLIRHAILQRATDIHIEPHEAELVVRYRIDGRLRESMVLPKEAEAPVTARIKSLSGLKADVTGVPQDGRFKAEANGERVSIRASIVPTCHGERTALRLAKERSAGFTLEHLGFHGASLDRMHEASKLSSGMVYVAGPSGSGRTTTLYTLVDLLNAPDVGISTVEDPVEYRLPRVSQTQARPEIGFTLAAGLRSVLRQDPDVVMVGETRDHETASLVAHAASTGRLVLSSVTAKTASSAIAKLRELGIDQLRLASTLSIVVGQRVVRKLPEGSERRPLTKGQLSALGKAVDLDRMLALLKEERVIGPKDGWDKVRFGSIKEGASSNSLTGIYEVLKVTSAIKELIVKGASAFDIDTRARKEGMVTMLEAGIIAAAQGRTSIEEVLKAVSQ